MTPEETQALSRRVAEALDTDEAWLPAERCPQGHPNPPYDLRPLLPAGSRYPIGSICRDCAPSDPADFVEGLVDVDGLSEGDALAVLHALQAAHSEWRIPRGEPKPYAESLDLLVPEVDGWCEWRRGYWRLSGGAAEIGLLTEEGERGLFTGVAGCKTCEALARAFLAAAERWGR